MKIVSFILALVFVFLLTAQQSAVWAKDPECAPGCTHYPLGNPNECYSGGRGELLGIPIINPFARCGERTFCPEDDKFFYEYQRPAPGEELGKCMPVSGAGAKTSLAKCITGSCDTAIGRVPVNDLSGLVGFLLKFVLGASGGIILVMIIITGYEVLTSSGNPEKLQGAKENIVSILSGFILIVFSLVLLQAVGADILKIPGF